MASKFWQVVDTESKNSFLKWKISYLYYHFRISSGKFWICLKDFWQGCWHCILRVQWNLLRKHDFAEVFSDFSFSYGLREVFFGHLGVNISLFWQHFFSRVVKNEIYLSTETFHGKEIILYIFNFLCNFRIRGRFFWMVFKTFFSPKTPVFFQPKSEIDRESKKISPEFRRLAKKLRFWQTKTIFSGVLFAFYVLRGTNWGKIDFVEFFSNSLSFRKFHRKDSDFPEKFLAGLLTVLSMCPNEHFENYLYSQVFLDFFINFGLIE